MKKKILAGILVVSAVALALVGCTVKQSEGESNSVTQNLDEGNDVTQNEDASNGAKPLEQQGMEMDDVCYYGCPNSKRVKKLNTKKNFLNR